MKALCSDYLMNGIGIIGGNQLRYQDQKQAGKQSNFTLSNFNLWGLWILVFGIFGTGCVSESSRTYGKEVVTTYAQLTLLYDKEKMINKLSDSLYQVKVKDFFKTKGIEEKVFRKGVEEFSRDEKVWKLFIQDVSAVMDSLKASGRP